VSQALAPCTPLGGGIWNISRDPAVGPKAGPAYVGADMRVADLAMATYAVAPSGCDHHMVTFQQASGFWNDTANCLYWAGDLVARDYRRRDIAIVLEKAVDQEHVGPAHAARRHLDQDLVRLDVGNSYVFKD